MTKKAKQSAKPLPEPAYLQATYDLNSAQLIVNFSSPDYAIHIHMNSRKVQKVFGGILKGENWLHVLPVLGAMMQQRAAEPTTSKSRKAAKDRAKAPKKTAKPSPAPSSAP